MSNQVTAPQIPAQPSTESQVAATTELDDLPADPTQSDGQGGGVDLSQNDDGGDPDFHDFESMLEGVAAQATPQQPAATPSTPAVDPTPVAPAQAPQSPQTQQVAPTGQQPQAGQQPQGEQPQQAQPQVQQPAAPQANNAQVNSDPAQALSNLQKQIEANRQTIVEAVAQHYEQTLTDDDVELLQTEPKKALAMMAARVHADGLSNTMSVLSQNLPNMVHALIRAERQQQEASSAFYTKFPQFNRGQHGAAIDQIATTVRQLNPQMPADQFMNMVAMMAMSHLGLQAQAPQAPAPAQPAAQPQARAPRGFAPAGASQAPQQRPNPATGNPWAAMAEAALLNE